MIQKVDLHLHTNASDGTWSNQQLLASLKREGISIFSITDHDTIANALAMRCSGTLNGFKYILGVEVSAYMENMRYHILAYGYNPDNADLAAILQHNFFATGRWFDGIAAYACSKYKSISLKEYSEFRIDPSQGVYKAVHFLMERGIISKTADFVTLAMESKLQPDYPSVAEVIRVIKKAGGCAFLAHPSEYKRKRMDIKDLALWRDLGIEGFECFHLSASAEDSTAYAAFCKANGLMISGGSDCHGELIRERRIGFPEIFEDMLDLSRVASAN